MRHITFKEVCWEFCHLTPSSRPSSPLLHKMVASQRWKTLPRARSLTRSPSLPSLTLPESKRGFPTHFICADEDHINVLCLSDAESGVVACTWCLIRKSIKKLFYRKVPQIIIVVLITVWFFKITLFYIHPINITHPIIIQLNLQVQ